MKLFTSSKWLPACSMWVRTLLLGSALPLMMASSCCILVPPFDEEPFDVTISGSVFNIPSGKAVEFRAVGVGCGSDGASYKWETDDGRRFDGEIAQIEFDTPGMHELRLKGTNALGEEREVATMIRVFPGSSPAGLSARSLRGDVTGDGQLGLDDAYLAFRQTRGVSPLPPDAEPADFDADGTSSAHDALLLAEAVARSSNFPSAVIPSSGSPGTLLLLLSPALQGAVSSAELVVDGTRTVPATQTGDGYAVALIPLDIAGPDPTTIPARTLSLRLRVDGADTEVFTFRLHATPAFAGDPRDELREALELARIAFEQVDSELGRYADGIGAGMEGAAALRAMVGVAADRFLSSFERLLARLDELDVDGARMFRLMANANGFDEALDDLRMLAAEPQPKARAAAQGMGPDFAELLCRLQDELAAIRRLSSATSFLCNVNIGLCLGGGFFPPLVALCPAVVQTCQAEMMMSLVETASEIVPRISGLVLSSSKQGEVISVRVEGQLDVSKFCDATSTDLVEKLVEKAVKRWIQGRTGGMLPETIEEIVSAKIAQALSNLSDAIGLGELLRRLQELACDRISPALGRVALAPDRLSRLAIVGPAQGALTAGPSTATYNCGPGDGELVLVAEKECGDTVAKGQTKLSCGTDRTVMITMGDNGPALDDIFEVRIDGQTVLTSNEPVREVMTSVELTAGMHRLEMIGRAAPDGIGTYFLEVEGGSLSGGPPLEGEDLNAGVVFEWVLEVP